MPIQALPQSTIRTIGAAQVLTSPVALVKELLDNALDAGASSVSIELSANALDVVQVRDNGRGIGPDDRLLVAKPSCTSKIRDIDDLAVIGGSSLGFRGEGLNSAVEISAGLTITTRVQGESVATALCFDKDGSIRSQDHVSHPFGTTVRVTGFLSVHAVRRKAMVKNAAKNTVAIKQLLQHYAFARPKTRLSLKILKVANSKDNWTYATKLGASLAEDAMRVVAKTCVVQCSTHDVTEGGYVISGLLPSRDADPTAITGIGQFVSIDRRPMSTSRGIGSRIVKVYKESLRASSHRLENARTPFVYISLTCPPGSYDANVEPAKDDVLFDNESEPLEIVRRMLAQHYEKRAALQEVDVNSPRGQQASDKQTVAQHVISSPADGDLIHDNADDLFVGLDDTTSSLPAGVQEAVTIEPIEDIRDVTVLNPWTLAKINSYGRMTDARTGSSPSSITNRFDTPLADQTMRPLAAVSSPSASTERRQLTRGNAGLQMSTPMLSRLDTETHGDDSECDVISSSARASQSIRETVTLSGDGDIAEICHPDRYSRPAAFAVPVRSSSGTEPSVPRPIASYFEPARQELLKSSPSASSAAASPGVMAEAAQGHRRSGRPQKFVNKPFKPQMPGGPGRRTSGGAGGRPHAREVWETCDVIPSHLGAKETGQEMTPSSSPTHHRQERVNDGIAAYMQPVGRTNHSSGHTSTSRQHEAEQTQHVPAARQRGPLKTSVLPKLSLERTPRQMMVQNLCLDLRNITLGEEHCQRETQAIWGTRLDAGMKSRAFHDLRPESVKGLVNRIDGLLSQRGFVKAFGTHGALEDSVTEGLEKWRTANDEDDLRRNDGTSLMT